MQTISPTLRNAFAAAVRSPKTRVLIRWDGTNYVDETAYVTDWHVTLRIAAPGENLVNPGDVGRGSVTLANTGGRFAWRNTASALYAQLGGVTGLGGKRIQVQVGAGAEYITIFTGYIANWSEDDAQNTVTLTLADEGWAHLQKRASTAVYNGLRPDQWIATLADLAGIGAGSRMLDAGYHTIPWCWLDDESLLEEIWRCANADGGRAYFDELGVLRYETAAHWLNHAKVLDLTLGDAFNLTPKHDLKDLAHEIIAEWSPRLRGMETVVYKLDALKAVRPGAELTIDARFSQPVLALAPLETNKDYVVRSGSGDDLTGVTLAYEAVNAQRARIRITNGHATKTAVISHLQARGWPLIGGANEQESATAASDPLGHGRVRTQRGNVYCQTEAQATTLAQLLAGRADKLQAVWPVNVWAAPQLELGDRVTLRGRTLTQAAEGYVIGIKLAFAASGLTQELDVLDRSYLYPYSNYFVVGTTALGASGGRAWY